MFLQRGKLCIVHHHSKVVALKIVIGNVVHVVDPFAGSNTTGVVAETLGRNWIAMERVPGYLEASKVRFAQQPAELRDGKKSSKQGRLFQNE